MTIRFDSGSEKLHVSAERHILKSDENIKHNHKSKIYKTAELKWNDDRNKIS